MLLRGRVVRLHLSEHSFHFAEDTNRVGNQIRLTIAFVSRDQRPLTLNPWALVENVLFADLDCRFGR
jgi:hypothetical protein